LKVQQTNKHALIRARLGLKMTHKRHSCNRSAAAILYNAATGMITTATAEFLAVKASQHFLSTSANSLMVSSRSKATFTDC
jgi:hypothetical protein